MRLRFLGTGTSFGVPVVGCECSVCRSDDPRNRRTRHGLLVEEGGTRLLVDTPPELREQLVEARVRTLDAVFLSHPHADHLHGIDDLRIFSLRSERALPVHVAEEYVELLGRRFDYIWGPEARPEPGTTIPELSLRPFRDREPFRVGAMEVLPVAFPHGSFQSYGLRVGELGVVVDAKAIPDDAYPVLEGVRVLVLNALWFGNPHPTHFNVEEALDAAARVGASHTYLTHLTHRLDYAALDDRLPEGVRPAYDGLTVDV